MKTQYTTGNMFKMELRTGCPITRKEVYWCGYSQGHPICVILVELQNYFEIFLTHDSS